MTDITFNGRVFPCADGDTVLEALTKGGAPVASSCRSGVCQTCLLRAVAGPLPEAAQKGLKDTLRSRGYFLACQCQPTAPLHIEGPGADAAPLSATVCAITPLNRDIVAVELRCTDLPLYRAGQFINVFRDPQTSRSYSLASTPGLDPHLTLHVRKFDQGRVSSWIHEDWRLGDTVTISGPVGECFYLPSNPDQPLLLLATGSGLAPLYGILRDALRHGHRGPIYLYHGSRHEDGLYLGNELRGLARAHKAVHYHRCVSQGDVRADLRLGRVLDVALADHAEVKGWRAFLCGHPDMVKQARKRLYLAGVALKDIYADAFVRAPA